MAASTAATRKAKGRKFQQWVRDTVREALGLNEADIESRSMGAGGIDIMLSNAAREKFPYAIECKNQERLSIWEAWKQATSNSGEELTPLLFVKRNYATPLVILDAKYFIELHKKVNNDTS